MKTLFLIAAFQTALPTINLTPGLILSLAGVVLTLAASYIPGFNVWYNNKDTVWKRLIMLFSILGVALVMILLSVTQLWVIVTLTKEGIMWFIIYILIAISTNQGVYNISPTAAVVQEIKDQQTLAKLTALSASSAKEG